METRPALYGILPTNPKWQPHPGKGTLGRNARRAFGSWQTDFALHRQLNLTERVNLHFRSEFFNAFNHPNFGNALGGLNSLNQIGGPRDSSAGGEWWIFPARHSTLSVTSHCIREFSVNRTDHFLNFSQGILNRAHVLGPSVAEIGTQQHLCFELRE